MTCSCQVAYEYCDEVSEVWKEGHRTTRKVHRCYECHAEIPAGTSVCVATSLYDGSWSTWYRCPTCSVYAEYLSMAVNECPLWGHLTGYVDDCGIDGVLNYYDFTHGGRLSEEVNK